MGISVIAAPTNMFASGALASPVKGVEPSPVFAPWALLDPATTVPRESRHTTTNTKSIPLRMAHPFCARSSGAPVATAPSIPCQRPPAPQRFAVSRRWNGLKESF
ncbi:hypothetical protein HRbin30_02617 [bacterium HR30]|nr:hypothetical protein HRbin30_02617 [bacterium HR30]